MNKLRFLTLASSVGLILTANVASADFIEGSLSFSNGFAAPFTPPNNTSIVSQLTSFEVDETVNGTQVSSTSVDFLGQEGFGTAFGFTLSSSGNLIFETSGFQFFLTNATVVNSTPLTCVGGLCADQITLGLTGLVSGSGFDDTGFLGGWTANGSCLGSNGECGEDPTASWSASLSATGGNPSETPEPASIALLGLGLVGMAAARRRLAKS